MSQQKKLETLLAKLKKIDTKGGSAPAKSKPKAKAKAKAKGGRVGHLGIGHASTGGSMTGGGFLGTNADQYGSNVGITGFQAPVRGKGDDWYGNQDMAIRGGGTKKGDQRKTARRAYDGKDEDVCGGMRDCAGGRATGGKSKSKATTSTPGQSSSTNSVHGGAKKQSPWFAHVAKVRKANAGKGLSQPEIVKLASKSYKK